MRKLTTIKFTALVFSFLFIVQSLFAQTRQVTGTVSDQTGKGIPGVTVTLKGTSNATQTDANGSYKINAPENATLIFSSVGYGTSEVQIGSRTSVDQSLTASNDNLSEVVVIGYGTARKKDLTGSVVITGTVSDQTGKGVPGVTVTVKGTSNATQTDANGSYKINAPENATLVFSSVGYGTSEVQIGTRTSVDQILTATNDNLSEVVVIGYGTARKKDLTGSVTSVKAKDFNQGFITAPDQLLQNKVPGLEITANSGQPGSATTIKIRGNTSIRAGNTPLYVVDGVPLDGRTARPEAGTAFGGTPTSNPLLFINPNDIAQIDVLKDASAAAIYGSRGANGVVVITTKKATAGPTTMEVGANFGVNIGYMRKLKVLDAAQFKAALNKYKLDATLDSGASVNALDAITQHTLSQHYNLSLSGGSETGKFRASFLGSKTEGFLKKTSLDKYLGSFGGQYKFSGFAFKP